MYCVSEVVIFFLVLKTFINKLDLIWNTFSCVDYSNSGPLPSGSPSVGTWKYLI